MPTPSWRRSVGEIPAADCDFLYRSLVAFSLFVCETPEGGHPQEAKEAIRSCFALLGESVPTSEIAMAVHRGYVAALTDSAPLDPTSIFPRFRQLAGHDDKAALLHLMSYSAAAGFGFNLGRARRFIYVCEGIGMSDKEAAAFLSRLIGFDLHGDSPGSTFPPFIVEALGLLGIKRDASATQIDAAAQQKAAPLREDYASWDGEAHTPATLRVTQILDARRVLLAFA